MKKLFASLLILSSVAVNAQVLPQNQCPQAGVLLARDYLGLAGENASNDFQRQGTHEIPTQAQFAGLLKARIFKVYSEKFCVAKQHHYQQQVCANVHPDIAVGRGSDAFRSLFDLNITLLKRADQFSRMVRYSVTANEATRMTTATEVVKHMTRLASTTGIPKSWEAFVATLKQIMTEGLMTQAEFDEIAVVNAAHNKRNLGFEPLPGVQYNEGKGNGRLQKIFDLSMTIQHRAAMIRTTFEGVTSIAAQNLAKSFIEFATANGIPSTWGQVVLMFRDAQVKGAISVEELNNITGNLELNNRANLGFEINYFTCKIENRVHIYNAVDESRKNEFHDEKSQNFRVFVASAPLLNNERETVTVNFHSMNGISAHSSQNYNSYTVEQSQEGDIAIFKLTGVRKLVTPQNSINAQVIKASGKVNINLQNTEFNPLVGGKVVVEAHFYEKVVLLKDKYLGVKTFELTDGNMVSFKPEMKMIKSSRPVYVQLKMKVVGSPYFNENLSEMKEFKKD